MRLKLLVLSLFVAALSGCAPVADVVADTIERSDGAVLAFASDGLVFDPGASIARGVVLVADGTDLKLTQALRGCEVLEDVLRCHLGDVESLVVVPLTGSDIIASASYRRTGSNTVYLVFGR